MKSTVIVAFLLALANSSVISRDGHDHSEGMDMDMDMDMNMENGKVQSATQAIESSLAAAAAASSGVVAVSTMTPIPHVSHHHHGVPILQTHLKPEERLFWENYNTTTFLNDEYSSKFNLYLHISTLLFTVIFVYPLTMVAKNVRNVKLYIPLFTVHSILMAISLISLSVYGATAPRDIYPNNAYSKMSWILAFSSCAQIISAIVYYSTSSPSRQEYHKIFSDDEESNSNQFSETTSNSSSSDWEHSDRVELNRLMDEKAANFSKSNFFSKITQNSVFQKIIAPLKTVANYLGISNSIVFNFLHWAHFFYFLIYIPTGVATVFALGKGDTVFNLLAHFIKGGVFFSLGLLYLARYCGGFTGLGWAWNCKFTQRKTFWNSLSMEMVESSLILFYGCTNIFMEHMANSGGEWSAKDLQHASIAFIYIGAGLCGVITEMKLASWKLDKAEEKYQNAIKTADPEEVDSLTSKIVGRVSSPGFSPNPFPVFTIYWTGILMSQHAQASELSTTIHSQWGNLLVYGCAFRLMTYLLMMFLPTSLKNLTSPSKPITEILASFSLLCGGLVFMESTEPVVLALEYRGFTAMFTLNISLGLIALLMAWEMAIFAFKDWLVARRNRRA